MRIILLFILSLFSMNVLAFECTTENTIDYPGYKGEPLVDMGHVIKPISDAVTTPMDGISKTYCMRGYPYKGAAKRKVLAVIQEGVVQHKGNTARYLFNFTDGIGATFPLDNLDTPWWNLDKPEWYLFCVKDGFSDAKKCMTSHRPLAYLFNDDLDAYLQVNQPVRPHSEVCVRIDENKPECTDVSDGWTGEEAYRLFERVANGKRVRVKYTNLADQAVITDDQLQTTYFARFIADMLIPNQK
ncbi:MULTISPECIES: hypothetical protein [Providencia]|uniref:hypothetical protein n=1 Tax=Providencia TaxID=586 RepID=UPI0015EC0594|nr:MULTISPECIES: hypothetical protein [Providencia]QLR03777.1 hypothetical protein H0913_12605 [Providencia rettgeri]WOB93964.1 hypothetical protein P3L54_14075 [Providencia sp. PROV099]